MKSNGNGSTISWGWKHLKAPDGQHDKDWAEALALGPTEAVVDDAEGPPKKRAKGEALA